MKCRCGHNETDHRGDGGIFPTERDTLAGGSQCRRCDCPYFHATRYKTRTSQLRKAARDLRGTPLQPRLFSDDTAQETENTGAPARPLARQPIRSKP